VWASRSPEQPGESILHLAMLLLPGWLPITATLWACALLATLVLIWRASFSLVSHVSLDKNVCWIPDTSYSSRSFSQGDLCDWKQSSGCCHPSAQNHV